MSERGLRLAVGTLAVLGTGIAAYLTWAHFQPGALVCPTGSGCETVQRSRYSELAGVPVAALGLVAYLAVAATALRHEPLAALAGAALAVAGLVFALWLVYVQASLLHAWCAWCLASDAVLALLAAGCLARAWRAAAPA